MGGVTRQCPKLPKKIVLLGFRPLCFRNTKKVRPIEKSKMARCGPLLNKVQKRHFARDDDVKGAVEEFLESQTPIPG